jgi:hypothetical protein
MFIQSRSGFQEKLPLTAAQVNGYLYYSLQGPFQKIKKGEVLSSLP